MQPLPHFINSTDFIIQCTTLLCNFNNFNNFSTLANAISNLQVDGAETPKHVGAYVI
jgi:hypothetical protein